jgi:hypothetical protein
MYHLLQHLKYLNFFRTLSFLWFSQWTVIIFLKSFNQVAFMLETRCFMCCRNLICNQLYFLKTNEIGVLDDLAACVFSCFSLWPNWPIFTKLWIKFLPWGVTRMPLLAVITWRTRVRLCCGNIIATFFLGCWHEAWKLCSCNSCCVGSGLLMITY